MGKTLILWIVIIWEDAGNKYLKGDQIYQSNKYTYLRIVAKSSKVV